MKAEAEGGPFYWVRGWSFMRFTIGCMQSLGTLHCAQEVRRCSSCL